MFGDKLSIVEALFVTVFSMGIVFFALIMLSFMIDGMSALFNDKKKKTIDEPIGIVENEEEVVEDNEEELVAVIAAAVAASLSTSVENITIKNIKRVPQTTPIWGRMGRQEQIYN